MLVYLVVDLVPEVGLLRSLPDPGRKLTSTRPRTRGHTHVVTLGETRTRTRGPRDPRDGTDTSPSKVGKRQLLRVYSTYRFTATPHNRHSRSRSRSPSDVHPAGESHTGGSRSVAPTPTRTPTSVPTRAQSRPKSYPYTPDPRLVDPSWGGHDEPTHWNPSVSVASTTE